MGYQEELTRRLISREAANTIKLGSDGKLYVGTGGVAPFSAEGLRGLSFTEDELNDMTKAQLMEIIEAEEIPVPGGTDGKVSKADLVSAILAHQTPFTGEP